MDESVLQQIEQILGYKFSDRSLLAKAFCHSSAVDSRFLSNERLEFLGDAVLGVVVCRTLFEQFPGYLEGNLTKVKSMLVSRRTCAKIAKQMGLQKFLKVGKGMESSSSLSGSLAAGVLEAVIAAIYIDGGFEAAREFVLRFFGSLIEQANAEHSQGNFKSLLQQYCQQRFNTVPVYELLDEKGPDHDKCFESAVVIGGRHFAGAWGVTKREAEQKAAFNALVELGLVERTSPDHTVF
jgi:ribonuclease-3